MNDVNTIENRLRRTITEQLAVRDEEIKPESRFVDDLGADSLDTIELIMALEEEFQIEIPDEDAERIVTVQQALDYITTHNGK